MTAAGSEPAGALGPLRRDPSRAGLFCDFDGTLAAIVDDPASARPLPGAMAALGALAGRLAQVWIVSGRPVDFLAVQAPPTVHLSGLYGLESGFRGRRLEYEGAAEWRRVIDAAAVAAGAAESRQGDLAGMRVEHKGLALTLHYRGSAGLADAVRVWATKAAQSTGLELHQARMSVELRPPLPTDKGLVVEAAARDLAVVCFIGDDRGDLVAFDALDRLAARGVTSIRIAVDSQEAPPDLCERADLVVAGPEAVVDLLASLNHE